MKGEGKMEENAKKAPQSAQKEKFNFKNWIEAHVAEFKRIVWPSKENSYCYRSITYCRYYHSPH